MRKGFTVRRTGSLGFTLVELLVVVAVLSIAGILVLTIFTRSLRGSNKSQIISNIKQNGQSVLENMDKTIRNADNVVCASSNNLVVVNRGTYTRYRFINPSPLSNPPVNGFIQKDNPEKQNVADSNPPRQETDPEFVNRVCDSNNPMLQATALTDINTKTGVSVENGLFTRGRQAGSKDSVTIKFNLLPGVSAPAAIVGQIEPVSFQTTVQLR